MIGSTATSPRQAGPTNTLRPTSSTPSAAHSAKMPPFLTPRHTEPHHNSSHRQPKTPSPNYFGFQAGVETNPFNPESPNHYAKKNFSPPSSTVRSTAAASPSIIPNDQNSEFDNFRRESEGKAFNLGNLTGGFQLNATPVKAARQRAASKTSSGQDGPTTVSAPRELPTGRPRQKSLSLASLDPASAGLSRSPKRVLSPGSMSAFAPDPTRRMSPAKATNDEARRAFSIPHNQPRFSLPLDGPGGPFGMLKASRADTLPGDNTSGPEVNLMVTPQYVVNLIEANAEDILVLDLRVSTQYAISHIDGALSLCIPTTLLKRPSFNVQKLSETFKDDDQRRKFLGWRNAHAIVIYDSSAAQLKDAQMCVNTINKFKNEGYEGTLYIIRGGFNEFSRRFPNYVAAGVDAQPREGVDSDGPDVAPVIGGCPMPITDKPANPFFGNIRQNMDLIGGVGQISLKRPSHVTKSVEEEFPDWLRQASEEQDQGKKVSNKFEAIERREKKRMEDALSGNVSWGNNSPRASPRNKVQIAGIEKGNKNRYNNIWPFEHSRVKLEGVPNHDCDYFNANYIQASWSHKRYISTQAPIPATFNDFWNVVWQQDVRVIVMLTAEQEGAQVKAHNYWDQRQYGPLHLEFLSSKRASLEPSRIRRHQQKKPSRSSMNSSTAQLPLAPIATNEEPSPTSEQPYVTVRKFGLTHERKPFEPMREITQLQYSSWPDFGAPAHPAHLLGLVEQTDAVVRATNNSIGPQAAKGNPEAKRNIMTSREPEPANSRPVMVHCSAGCGRTGTFCTVDSVIDMLKRQRLASAGVDAETKGVSAPKPVADQHDFFAPRPSVQTTGVQGPWLQRTDQDLVEKTVEDFRLQRLSMVQSLRQFVLCYESVMEWMVEENSHDPK